MIRKFFNWIFNIQDKPIRYILKIFPVMFLPALVLSLIFNLIFQLFGFPFKGASLPETFVSFFGITPLLLGMLWIGVTFTAFIETLIMIPVFKILQIFTKEKITLTICSTLIWAIAHGLLSGVKIGWAFGVFWPFLILSGVFLAWREKSLSHAFWVTSILHTLHNGILVTLLYLALTTGLAQF